MRPVNLLLLYFSFWSLAFGQSANVYFEQITTADGLPENSVAVMLQDHLGFIWLGTRNGLVRYDGVNMTVFQHDPKNPFSLKGRFVTCLYEDRKGDIWVGYEGGLSRFDRSTEHFIPYFLKGKDTFYAKDRLEFIHQDKTGNFWVVTFKKAEEVRVLSRYNPTADTWTHYRHQEGSPIGPAYTNVLQMTATGVPRMCVREDNQGRMWAVTRKALDDGAEAILHCFDRKHDTFIPYYPKGISEKDPSFRFLKAPYFSRQGELWVPTHGYGLFRINPVTNQVIARYRHNGQNPQSLLCDTLRTVYEDRSGFIWLSTRQGLDRLDPQTGLFTHFLHDPQNSHTPHDIVLDAIGETKNGHIWFLTTVGGLDEFDPKTQHFIRYEANQGIDGGLSGEVIHSFLIDRTDLVWASSNSSWTNEWGQVAQGGLNRQSQMTRFLPFKYQSAISQKKPYSRALAIYEAPSEPGVYWIGTLEGLNRFEKKTGMFTHYVFNANRPRMNRVTSLVEDSQGNFWVGTTNGLYQMDRKKGTFTRFGQNSMLPNRLSHNVVTALLASRDSTLWIGTPWGLNHFEPKKNRFTNYTQTDTTYHPDLIQLFSSLTASARRSTAIHYSSDTAISTRPFVLKESVMVAVAALGSLNSISKNEYGWIEDSTGHIVWEMTYRRTKSAGPGKRIQMEVLRLPAGKFRLYYKRAPLKGIGKESRFVVMPTSYYPELWGIQAVPITPSENVSLSRLMKKWAYNGLSGNTVQALHQDKKGRIWIGLSNGLDRFDPHEKRFLHYKHQENGIANVNAIHEDSKGMLWLGDYENGLLRFNPATRVLKRYTKAEGLSHNSITGIQSDEDGHLWLSTYNGISRFHPITQRFRSYTVADGLDNMIFRYPTFKDSEGTFFFLSDYGINTLAKNQKYDDPYLPQAVLTEVTIFNQKAAIGPKEPLQTHISVANKLTLGHNQNDFTFHFAALHYNRSAECRYEVQLEPYDKEWIPIGTARQIRYMSLAPGTYTFRVRAANADGLRNSKATSIQVIVLSPWWASWWAYGLYTLLFGGLLTGFIRYRIIRENQRREITFQQREAKRLLALDEVKTRFFSNITHEFRTPLSLIIAPVDKLLHEENLPTAVQRSLSVIRRNAGQLLQLINQLLDLSKLETGNMSITEFRGDVIEFFTHQLELFQPMAEQKQISLTFDADQIGGDYLFDAVKWERIISNLLSNALKFTPPKGTVSLSLQSLFPNWIELSVQDTGIGIPTDKLPHIFERFYQIDDSQTRSNTGTGIGLSLVKELTDLLGGHVQVSSEVAKGTKITVNLPAQKMEALETTDGGANLISKGIPTDKYSNEALIAADLTQSQPLILVVEDHEELREFIQESLSAEFRVLTAANGEQGRQLARLEVPDVVISDLMMPIMDGYELCQRLKSDPITDHIAVVLLTARSSEESRLEGLLYGADDYLTKPFNPWELQQKMRNIISRQQKLRQHYTHLLSAPDSDPKSEAVDNIFLQKLYSLLEDRLDDSSFGVDELAESLAMSRRTLYRKLATLVNLPASELIQQYRLKRAAELLMQGQPVSQTAYQVGFESPQYFAKVFKAFYQFTPTEFSQRN
jgi:signal transduction histidine kinase/ligand-binding sensor domain-containing protein/DNA-binding response OmpR family regulator